MCSTTIAAMDQILKATVQPSCGMARPTQVKIYSFALRIRGRCIWSRSNVTLFGITHPVSRDMVVVVGSHILYRALGCMTFVVCKYPARQIIVTQPCLYRLSLITGRPHCRTFSILTVINVSARARTNATLEKFRGYIPVKLNRLSYTPF